MTEILVIVIFIAWYVLSMIISEKMGKKSKIGVEWSFFYCMIFSPIVGFFITYLTSSLPTQNLSVF